MNKPKIYEIDTKHLNDAQRGATIIKAVHISDYERLEKDFKEFKEKVQRLKEEVAKFTSIIGNDYSEGYANCSKDVVRKIERIFRIIDEGFEDE